MIPEGNFTQNGLAQNTRNAPRSFFPERKSIEVVGIEEWLDLVANRGLEARVLLPMIQRGSVWKADQVVNLWDSLLRGMPVGSLTVSLHESGVEETVREIGGKKEAVKRIVPAGSLSLLDGQQRTLAMCIGWPSANVTNRRLWLDFAKRGLPGQPFCLRMTTQSQPFGFQLANPSQKLARWEKRKARAEFDNNNPALKKTPDYKLPLDETRPFGSSAATFDIRVLIGEWLIHRDRNTWMERFESEIIWDKEMNRTEIRERLEKFGKALPHLLAAEIALLRVPSRLLEVQPDDAEDTEPPLVVLFERIANAGARLSPEDYAFSLIKHRFPEAHNLVQELHGSGNIASLMSANDLVMTAVRVAVNMNEDEHENPLPDQPRPSAREFNRLIRRKINGGGDFLKDAVHPLLKKEDAGSLHTAFARVQKLLEYRSGQKTDSADATDPGFPLLAFPILPRPLVQLFVFWMHRLLVRNEADHAEECREEVLRFVLFWLLCVDERNKESEAAGKIAFEEICGSPRPTFPGWKIAKRLCSKELTLAIVIEEPSMLEPLLCPAEISTKAFIPSRWSVFRKPDDKGNRASAQYLAEAWSSRWKLLLWLQRKGIQDEPAYNDVRPLAGPEHEQETPYDFDHITPHDDWHRSLHYKNITSFRSFCEDIHHHGSVGDSIGNIRVWESSSNRSDGSASPLLKLDLADAENAAERVRKLDESCITEEEADLWTQASPEHHEHDEGDWSAERARSFHLVVGKRALRLYQRYYDEAKFARWSYLGD